MPMVKTTYCKLEPELSVWKTPITWATAARKPVRKGSEL